MIFRKGKYKEPKLYFKIFLCPYPMDKPTKKFEAIFLQLGRKGFWLFRNEQVHRNWPSCSG